LFAKKHRDTVSNSEQHPANFEYLYDTHKSMVLGVALRYVRCREDANDVVQETFISMYTNYVQYDAGKPFSPWMKRIAINTALMYIRKNYRYKLIENERDFAGVSFQSEEDDDQEFTQQDLVKILQELPDGYRMVFNLYAVDGLTHKEIAEYLEITESTSRTQLLKARKMIKGLLESKMNIRYERA